MSSINLNNYEAYLLDYFEGSLSDAAISELKKFVLLHPELNIQLDDSNFPYLSGEDDNTDQINTEFKNDFLKSETELELSQTGLSKNDIEIINYLEGNLSDKEKINFENKLLSDGDLNANLNLYKKTILTADDQETIENKKELLKSEDELILNNPAILYVEGLLNDKEISEFEKEIKSNAILNTEIKAFEKTKVNADYSIVHPDKNSLKKEARVISLFSTRNVIAIAAAILIIIGLIILFNSSNSNLEFKGQKAEARDRGQEAGSRIQVTGYEKGQKAGSTKQEEARHRAQNIGHKVQSTRYKKQEARGKTMDLGNKKQETGNSSLNNNENLNNIAKQNEKKEENKQEELMNKKDSILVFDNTKNISEQNDIVFSNKQTTLLTIEESDDDYDVAVNPIETKNKNGFWKTAVKVVKFMNNVGAKAIKGDEKEGEKYLISFNNFSVEKK